MTDKKDVDLNDLGVEETRRILDEAVPADEYLRNGVAPGEAAAHLRPDASQIIAALDDCALLRQSKDATEKRRARRDLDDILRQLAQADLRALSLIDQESIRRRLRDMRIHRGTMDAIFSRDGDQQPTANIGVPFPECFDLVMEENDVRFLCADDAGTD